MNSTHQGFSSVKSFTAGVLIGLAAISPVFAATESTSDQWHTFLMLGALVLLILGLMLEAVMHSEKGHFGRKARAQRARSRLNSRARADGAVVDQDAPESDLVPAQDMRRVRSNATEFDVPMKHAYVDMRS